MTIATAPRRPAPVPPKFHRHPRWPIVEAYLYGLECVVCGRPAQKLNIIARVVRHAGGAACKLPPIDGPRISGCHDQLERP